MTKTRFRPKALTILAVALLVLGLCVPAMADKLMPKADNFILFQDWSGSMGLTHPDYGKVKIVLSKELLVKMNEAIPNLKYKNAFVLFAPYKEIQKFAPYDKATLKKQIDGVATDFEVFNRLTTMGIDLDKADKVLADAKGTTAFIIISDGESNLGHDPVPTAKALYDKYQGRVCFHIVSLADNAQGKKTLAQIAAINPTCTVTATAGDLRDKAKMDKFVQDVFFYTDRGPKAVIVAPDKAATGQKITLDGTKSTDPDNKPLTYAWSLCDGTTAEGATVTKAFNMSKECKVSLTVTDVAGSTDTTSHVIAPMAVVAPVAQAEAAAVPIVEEIFVFRNIQFDFNKAVVKPEWLPVLDAAADIIKDRQKAIAVEGHTDSVGGLEYNQKLSQQRAAAVKDILVKDGVEASKIETRGYGKTQPRYTNDTKQGRDMNRRVEIKLK